MPRTLWCILLLALFPTFGVADEILFSTGPDQQRFDSNGEGLPSFGTAGTSSYSVTDKFILRSTSAITGIGFSAWVDHGTTPVSLAWQITSAPGNGIIAEGDASLTNTPEAANICGCDVYWSTFSTSDVVLGLGTYWLLLSNGTPTMSWGLHSDFGSSVQFNNRDPYLSWGTQSFEVFGAIVPETGTLVLAGCGLATFALKARLVLNKR